MDVTNYILLKRQLEEIAKNTGGVTSWNDLTDKPFGEEIGVSDTINYDGSDTEVRVGDDTMGLYFNLVSSDTPSAEQLIGGESTIVDGLSGGEEFTITIKDVNIGMASDGKSLMVSGSQAAGETDLPFFAVAYEDGVVFEAFNIAFPKKGIYLLAVMEYGTYTSKVYVPNYEFTTTVIKTIDEKYLPTSIFGTSGTVTLAAAGWDADNNSYTFIVNELGDTDAIFFKPSDLDDKGALDEADCFITNNGQTVTFYAATIPTSDINLTYFVSRGK